MCAHIAKDAYAHISCASCKRVPIKCIRPDAVEYVPARQRLQSRDPGGEESLRYNQATEVMVKSCVCCRLNMHQPSPQQNRSAMADLSRTDRLQPGRGCTSWTSQRLHNPARAIQRFTVAGAEAVRRCGASEAWAKDRLGRQQRNGTKPQHSWTDAASASFAVALFLLRMQQLLSSDFCFVLISNRSW